MRLHPSVADDLVKAFAAKLSGGSLVLYAGPRPSDVTQSGVQRALVKFALPSPAFMSPLDGAALGYPLPVSIIDEEGKAVWAQFRSATGAVVADGSVGTKDADVILPKTDLQRHGTVEITSHTLRLPLGTL